MNIRKILAAVAAAAVFLTAIPILSPLTAGENSFTLELSDTVVYSLGDEITPFDGAYSYYVDSTKNVAVISRYSGSDSTVEIPAEIDGYPVIGIIGEAFRNNSTITRVVIPEGVEFLGGYFEDNYYYDGVFSGCSNLASVSLPESLWYIGNGSFSGTAVRSVSVPEYVTYIGTGAFRDCTALTRVNLPESLTDIPANCFRGCTSLRTITLPSNVDNIFGYAFAECTSLSTVVFPEMMTMSALKSEEGIKKGEEYNNQFENCTNLRTVTLPDSMTCIPYGMFKNSGLSKIKIGSSTTNIGCDAFYGCTLTDLYLPDDAEIDFSGFYISALNNWTVTGKLSVSTSLEEESGYIPAGEYEIRGKWTITSADNNFELRNIYISEGRAEFSPDEVSGFGCYVNVYLPDTVTKITCGEEENSALNTLTLGSGLVDIQPGALDNCRALEKINVGKAGKYISYNGLLFADNGYTFVKFPNNWKTETNSNYVYLEIPDGTKKIADYAFSGRTNSFDSLSLYIPESVTEIGEINFCKSWSYNGNAVVRGDPWNVLIVCKAGSEAERFAKAHNIDFTVVDSTPESDKYTYTETVVSPQSITRENTNFTQPTFAGDHGEVKGTLVYTDSYGSVMTYEGVRAMLANYRSGTYTIGYRFTPDYDSVYGGEKSGVITLDMTRIPVSSPVVTATAESSRVFLSWAAVDEAIAYEINLVDGDSIVKVGDTTQTSYAYTDVAENGSYSFLVRAYDGDNFSDYTDEDIVTVIVKPKEPADPFAEVSVVGHSLILADNIGVNFYMTLSDEILADSDAYMEFRLPNESVSRILVNTADIEQLNGKTVYTFPCFVAASEMTDTISARIISNGRSSDEYTYSVMDYAQCILESPERYTYTVPVVKAMLNYGTMAQEFFGHNTQLLANSILADEDKTVTGAEEIDLSSYGIKITDNNDTLSYKGIALSLRSRIVIKLYFESDSELNINDFKVSDGVRTVADSRLSIGTDDNGTFLAIKEINAADFDKSFKITAGNLTVDNVSVFSYIYQALAGSQSNLNDVVCSIYDYNCAIEDYLAAVQSELPLS